MVNIIQRLLISVVILGLMGCSLTLTDQQLNSKGSSPSPVAASPIPNQTILILLSTSQPPGVNITPQVSEAGTPPNNVFGMTLYRFDETGGLLKAAEAGTAWSRKDFFWSRIEPSPGERLWDVDLEQELINLSSYNVQPVMIIGSTPGWALKNGFNCGAVAEDQFPTLAQFTYDLVKRYSVPPYNVRYWELWNEPDASGLLGCWGDPSDTQYYGGYYYGKMLQTVYPRIKEADPSAQVMVGGLLLDCDPNDPPEGKSCLSSNFLMGILESGGGPYFDGVSFHAYDFYFGEEVYGNGNWHSSSSTTGPVSIVKANFLRNVLSEYGYKEKYLMNTEMAVFWGPNVINPPCGATPEEMPPVEETKVNYVIHSYAVAVAEGWKASIWYSAIGVRCSGLLNIDLSPKGSYYAYQFTEQKLGGAIFVNAIDEYEGVMGYEFETADRRLVVIWSMDGLSRTLILPRLPLEVNQIGGDGRAVQELNSLNLTLQDSPLFIEFEQ